MAKAFNTTKVLKITAALAVMLSLVGYVVDGIVLPHKWWYATDFSWYYYGAKVGARGGDFYDGATMKEAARSAGEPDEVIKFDFYFTYPPFFVIFMRPFLLFSHARARILWLFLNNGLYALAIILCIAALRERISFFEAAAMAFAALNFNPVFRNLFMGQINVVTFFLLALALYAFKHKADYPAGALLGLAAMIKVLPGLFIVYFLFKRRWKVVMGAALAAVFLLIISLALLGIEPHKAYIFQRIPAMVSKPLSYEDNHSLAAFFYRLFGYRFKGEAFFHNGTLARIFSSSIALLFLAMSFLITGRAIGNDHLRWNLDLALFALTVNIISPLTWEFHMVWLMLPVITLIHYLFTRSAHPGSRPVFIFLFLTAYIVLAARFPGHHPAFQSGVLVLFISIKLYAMILLWALLGLAIRRLTKKGQSL